MLQAGSSVAPLRSLESVLLLSVRSFRHQAANGSLYEFEDVIASFCDTTICCPVNEMAGRRKIYRSAKYLGLSDRFADCVSSMAHLDKLETHHNLILVVLDNPWQMHLLNQIKGWRDHPAKKVCYVSECWPRELSEWRLMKEPFSNFDHIFLGLASSVPVLASQIDTPCSYLPCGVNTRTFVDVHTPASRVIDVSYIGRRENALHDELKRFADTDKLFYLFDTAKSQKLFVDDPAEHRKMYASMLKRTRVSLALPAKSNLVKQTGGIEEIATRFFEFAAAGVVIVGRAPDSNSFRELFDWKDAVVSISDGYQSAPKVIRRILHDQQYAQTISKRNIIHSLRNNDWIYRFMEVVAATGFAPNHRMLARVSELEQHAMSLEAV